MGGCTHTPVTMATNVVGSRSTSFLQPWGCSQRSEIRLRFSIPLEYIGVLCMELDLEAFRAHYHNYWWRVRVGMVD